jgi:hypothetical protein
MCWSISCIGEARLRRHAEDALGHHLADFATMRMNVFLRQPAWANEERDPSSVSLLGTGLCAAEQIAFSDNAEKRAGIAAIDSPGDPRGSVDVIVANGVAVLKGTIPDERERAACA